MFPHRLAKAHSEAKQYQHKAVPNFENLQILYGSDRATGKEAGTSKESILYSHIEKENSNSVTSVREGNKEAELEDEGDSVAPSLQKMQDPFTMGASSKVTYKRKHAAGGSLGEDFQVLKSGMESVASAISKCGPQAYTESELYEEVLKVEGLEEDAQIEAYDYLCGDSIRGRTFIGLPISRRKRWLEIKKAIKVQRLLGEDGRAAE